MTDTRRVVLVDLSNIFWSSWHSAANAKEQTQTEAAFSFTLNAVHRCRKEGELLAICLDVGKSFRRGLSAEYKAKRPEKYATALETLDRVKVRLKQDGCLLWGVNQYEADDVIAAATTAAVDAGHEVLVCTADKDLLQLTAKKGVTVLRTYNEWKMWDAETVRSTLGIEPYQMQDFLALVGDASDNIKGASGIGDKTAVKLLQQYGDVPGIYEALAADPAAVLPNAKPGVSAASASLAAFKAQVELALSLVRLNPPPLKFEEIYEVRETQKLSDVKEEETMDEAGFPPGFEAPRPAAQEKMHKFTDFIASKEEIADLLSSKAAAQVVETKPEPQPQAQALELRSTRVEVDMPFEKRLEPTSAQAALILAKHMHDSGLYRRFPNAPAIMSVILLGREWGYGAAQSLELFHFFEGRVVPHAHLIIAKVQEHPDCEYLRCVSSDATQATYEAKNRRNPKPYVHKYSIEDAARAGLTGRPIWKARPAEMLRKTAGVQAGRIEIPGAALGLYSLEEMGGDE